MMIPGLPDWQRVDIIGHLLGPGFGGFAPSCVRMNRLEAANTPNLEPKKCPMIPALGYMSNFLIRGVKANKYSYIFTEWVPPRCAKSVNYMG